METEVPGQKYNSEHSSPRGRSRRGPSVTPLHESDLLWHFAKEMVSIPRADGPVLYMDETGKVQIAKVLYVDGPGQVQVYDYDGHSSESRLVTPLEGDALQRNLLHLFDPVWRDESSGFDYARDIPGLPNKREEKIVRMLICVQTSIFNPPFAIVAVQSQKRPQLELPIVFTNGSAPGLHLSWAKAQERFSWLSNFKLQSGQHLYLRVKDDKQMHYIKFMVTPCKDFTEINEVFFGTPGDFMVRAIGPHFINPRDSTHVGRLFRERTVSSYTALVQKDGGWDWEERDRDGIHAGSYNAASRYCPPTGAIVQVWDSHDQAARPSKSRLGARGRGSRPPPREAPEVKHRCIQNAKIVRWFKPSNIPVAPTGFVTAPMPAAPTSSYGGPPPPGNSGYGGPTSSYGGPPPPGNSGYGGPPPPGNSGYGGPPPTSSYGSRPPAPLSSGDDYSYYRDTAGMSSGYGTSGGEYRPSGSEYRPSGSEYRPSTPEYRPSSPAYEPDSYRYNPDSPGYSPRSLPTSATGAPSSFPVQSFEDV